MQHRAEWFLCAVMVLIGATVLSLGAAIAAEEDSFADAEVIDMTPDDPVGWSLRNVIAPVISLFQGGLGYYYDPREVRIDTTPSNGFVDLFYVRRNFQKRFEQAQTPVIVLLPPRIKAGPRDALTIRAFREGYKQKSITIPVASRDDEILLNLEPLPNTLVVLSHRYFAERSSLVFLTSESPTFRIQETIGGFTMIMSETARSPEAAASLEGIRSPMLDGAFAQQLGEDLVVKVQYAPGVAKDQFELRTRDERDAARDLFGFSLDIIPIKGSGEAIANAKAALAGLKSSTVRGCALLFDSQLRERLGVGELARALTPKGAFTDPYFRAAMRRLGELSANGKVEFLAGNAYRPEVPIELEAALIQSAEARGYLALLRGFVDHMEKKAYREVALRSLIAPELDAVSFSAIMNAAEAQEKSCLASR